MSCMARVNAARVVCLIMGICLPRWLALTCTVALSVLEQILTIFGSSTDVVG
jgi:hypothetical protein